MLKQKQTLLIIVSSLSVVLLILIAIYIGTSSQTSTPMINATIIDANQNTPIPQYETNQYGQTYGSYPKDLIIPVVATPQNSDVYYSYLPDLVAVVDSDGDDGYVYARDLFPIDYTRTSEAGSAVLNAQNESGTIYIPVFSSDGRTETGLFALHVNQS